MDENPNSERCCETALALLKTYKGIPVSDEMILAINEGYHRLKNSSMFCTVCPDCGFIINPRRLAYLKRQRKEYEKSKEFCSMFGGKLPF